jgi:HEAT repeat protein
MDAPALIRILTDASSPEFKKAKACQRVGELGAKEAVPALFALLADEHLSVYARYGLEPIAALSADDALRAALSKLKGKQLIGVINSIGKRRDAKASPALASMIYGSDADVARASASALGSVSGPSSVKELQAALAKTKGTTRMAVADASLVCAERLLPEGKRDEALALYTSLSAPMLVPYNDVRIAQAGVHRAGLGVFYGNREDPQ